MDISRATNSLYPIKKSENKMNNVSFKGIFIDSKVDLGPIKEKSFPPKFLKKDELMLNEISQQYPNQDCFIRRDSTGLPRLEYRERPCEVQVFQADASKHYNMSINSIDVDHPCESLIIYPDSPLSSIIGIPSNISSNPSLPFTIKVGFELHKKLLGMKMQIMDIIGSTDSVNFGSESIMQKAHKAIEDIETAVTCYLVDCAYETFEDSDNARKAYEADYDTIQSVLDSKRKLDLITSVSKQSNRNASENIDTKIEIDIIEEILKTYPDMGENTDRLNSVVSYLKGNNISLNNLMK